MPNASKGNHVDVKSSPMTMCATFCEETTKQLKLKYMSSHFVLLFVNGYLSKTNLSMKQ